MIRFADPVKIPDEAVTQPWAILGRRGSGKTYAATRLAEELHRIGAQFIAIDPVGVWSGLRTAADGKAPGIPVPVFGGADGDVPLAQEGAEGLALALAKRGLSAILDVSHMRKAERVRFVGIFCEALFEAKKHHRSAVHVFFEEAQLFAPQRTPKGEGGIARMLGAVEDLCRLGRNYGIGYTLISQRPQSVNKEVLNQAEILLAMQLSGKHERAAVAGWIVHQGLEVEGLENKLPALQTGEAFLWSPALLGITERVKVRKKWTLDSSGTPELGKVQAVRRATPKDLDIQALLEMVGTETEEALANKPATLRKRIAHLERDLAKAQGQAPEVERVEVPVFDAAALEGLRQLADKVGAVLELAPGVAEAIRAATASAQSSRREPPARPRQPAARAAPPARMHSASPPPEGWEGLAKGEAAVLAAVVAAPSSPATRDYLTVTTGYKRSTRDTYIRRLTAAGLLELAGSGVEATAEGRGLVPRDEAGPPRGADLLDHWLGNLPAGEARILQAVSDGLWSREEISEATQFKRSTRDTYIRRLASRGLVAVESSEVRLSNYLR